MAPKQEYRLKALLGIRERKKEEAEQHLARCLAALRQEEERLREMEEELERMIANREAKRREYSEKAMRGEMQAQSAVSANVFIERLKEKEEQQKYAIEGQIQVVEQRTEDVAEAQQELVVAAQELKALEKHREKWEEEVKRERMIKEEQSFDEIAQTIYMNRDPDLG